MLFFALLSAATAGGAVVGYKFAKAGGGQIIPRPPKKPDPDRWQSLHPTQPMAEA